MSPYVPGALGRSSVLQHTWREIHVKETHPGPTIFLPHHHDIPVSDLTCRASPPSATMLPGFPVLYQLPELAQTHVYQVGDAINH